MYFYSTDSYFLFFLLTKKNVTNKSTLNNIEYRKIFSFKLISKKEQLYK